MGSFNIACSISKINIFSGDEVWVFPLIENVGHLKEYSFVSADKKTKKIEKPWKNHHTCVGSASYWTPHLPFKAKYNDYGWFEGVSADKANNLREFLNTISTQYLVKESEMEAIKVILKNKNKANLDNALEALGELVREDLHVRGLFQASAVSFAAVDARVMQQILEHPKYKEFRDAKVKEVLKSLKEAQKDLGKKKNLTVLDLMQISKHYVLERALKGGESNHGLPKYGQAYSQQWLELIKNEPKAVQEFEAFLQDYCLMYFLDHELNHNWAPASYAGQEYSNKLFSDLHTSFSLAAREKDFDKDKDEYDESYQQKALKIASMDITLFSEEGKKSTQHKVSGMFGIDDLGGVIKDKLNLEHSMYSSEEPTLDKTLKSKSAKKPVKLKI